MNFPGSDSEETEHVGRKVNKPTFRINGEMTSWYNSGTIQRRPAELYTLATTSGTLGYDSNNRK